MTPENNCDAITYSGFELFDVNCDETPRVAFQILISTLDGEVLNIQDDAWAPTRLGSKVISILEHIAARARQHISGVAGIRKSLISSEIRTVKGACFGGLLIRSWQSLPVEKQQLARTAGTQLANALMSNSQPPSPPPDTTAVSTSETTIEATRNHLEEQRRADVQHIAACCIAAVSVAAKTAEGGQLRVAASLPGQATGEPLVVKSSDAAPAAHVETAPWLLTSYLERDVSKNVIRVRRVDDRQPIRLEISGTPEIRLDLRLFRGGGPVALMVSGIVDGGPTGVEPTVRLISVIGLDVARWAPYVDLIETIQRRLDMHRRTLEEAGLLPRTL